LSFEIYKTVKVNGYSS